MRGLPWWRVGVLAFAAGWWCCAQVDLWLEELQVVAQAEADTKAAASEGEGLV